MHASYLRLDVHVLAGWLAVVRAAAGMIRRKARRDPAMREARKRFYEMLARHRDAQHLVHRFRL